MESAGKKSRMLGWAFLIQFVTSFACGVFLLPLATGVQGFGMPKDLVRTMATIAGNASLMQLNIILELVTAAGVIFLGACLYAAVAKLNKAMALTAFGLYLLESVLIAVKLLVLFALLAVSRKSIAAGNPASLAQTAELLYEIMSYANKFLNIAFCMGATVFYALLLKARTIARPFSLWGLLSVQGVFAGTIAGLFGMQFPVFLAVPYIPFELAVAIWILIKGVDLA